MRVAGIMSGTSLDGIDVAIVEITGTKFSRRVEVLAVRTTEYPRLVREALFAISNTITHTASVSRLNFLLGELYADAFLATCSENGIDPKSVGLIGMHGQTIFHEGDPVEYLGHRVASTLQIGEAAVVAERTGILTVSNFRERDMAAGGRGAPLVPYVDYLLFRDNKVGRVALNIGGIANLTAIPARSRPEHVMAFDTGPGNMVMDALVGQFTDGKQRYDRAGRIAAKGNVHERLLLSMLSDSYYSKAPPKTAGREQYGQEFVSGLMATGIPVADLIATATELTARTIALAIQRFVEPYTSVRDLIASGGGAHNDVLMARLGELLPQMEVTTSADFGIDVDGKEAIAFAVLAHASGCGEGANVPSATGARRAAVLGKVSAATR
jgi:anhydro-N-acetylmuramic acid kinase